MNRIFAICCALLVAVAAAASDEVRFEKPGLFLDAQPGASHVSFRLPTQAGRRYNAMRVNFRMHVGKLQPVFNSFVAVTRPKGGNYFAFQVRSDKSKTIVDKMNGTQYGEVVTWKEDTEYRVQITYEPAAGKIAFEALLPGGGLFQRFETTVDKRVIEDLGEGVFIEFGLPRVYAKAYYPPLTWKFSELVVKLVQAPE